MEHNGFNTNSENPVLPVLWAEAGSAGTSDKGGKQAMSDKTSDKYRITMNDTISRQAAIDAAKAYWYKPDIAGAIERLPSAQPEPLTDKEQRIFLAAMSREEKVCKQVDEECRDCREPYEDSLVRVCHEIMRKVKKALWET